MGVVVNTHGVLVMQVLRTCVIFVMQGLGHQRCAEVMNPCNLQVGACAHVIVHAGHVTIMVVERGLGPMSPAC